MKLAILGSRGIPNRYGGFEKFAEQLSVGLVQLGHDVTVYNSHVHPYQEPSYQGVKLIHCHDGEPRFGTFGQFIYDLNCIRDSRARGFDLILQLGYTSNSVWGWLLPPKAVIVTNMDGMEWMRSKYSKPVQRFLRRAEAWAVHTSDYLVSDALWVQQYLKDTYRADSRYIAYGADRFSTPDASRLRELSATAYGYDLVIGRIEPENNIEAILQGVSKSQSPRELLIFANKNNDYAQQLIGTYRDPRIRFMGGLFDQELLNHLRYYSNLYFHGHSVGGTNPSLVEALAGGALVVAHQNPFNMAIVGQDGYFFQTADEIAHYRDRIDKPRDAGQMLENNWRKIDQELNTDRINRQYEEYLKECLAQGLRRHGRRAWG